MPDRIEVRGARVHNLKDIDVDIPLNRIVGIAGVSGSGKSSLALGVLYAEGSRKYLESLSTYTRRRMTQVSRADVEEVLYVPASLALHQRPGVPGIRSTFGTGTELLNSIRLMFSRLSSHLCPNGHRVPPSLDVALEKNLICPTCKVYFQGHSAEELSFNSTGACKSCSGTGVIRTVNRDSLVPDQNLTLDQGAVAPWNSLMWKLIIDLAKSMGVRTDVPFKDLTEKEKSIVYDGPLEKRHILYRARTTEDFAELDFTYYSAVNTVLNALSKVKDESGMKRVEKFLKEETCPDCMGTRLSEQARSPLLCGYTLDQVCTLSLKDLCTWVREVPDSLPEEMKKMALSITDSFFDTARRLLDLGLAYLSMDRAANTLSTGERQRMQLARSVRNRTTGVLYVLDEPSIGLHPANIEGLIRVMKDLVKDGNSVVLVDHDTRILKASDWIIELGPGAGADGGKVISEGTIEHIEKDPSSVLGPYLIETKKPLREKIAKEELFSLGTITMDTGQIHTVKPLNIQIPKGRLTVVTGVSGSGKTTMVLESLVPGLRAEIDRAPLPSHVRKISAPEISSVKLIDASSIGINVRSTVSTYADIHDELRKIFSRTDDARRMGFKAGDFSYNTGRLRCPTCDGTGQIVMDVQFLPDVTIDCPDCRGSRYSKEAYGIKWTNESGENYSLPELMSLSVTQALGACIGLKNVCHKLQTLESLGLGYLTLGEDTPSLSGGEAQRLKLAFEMGRIQSNSLFVFDEPTIGLHPRDVRTLVEVFNTLIDAGGTLVVIEHDPDIIRSADYLIDMGPGGGESGGRVVVSGTLEDIKNCPESVTGRYL